MKDEIAHTIREIVGKFRLEGAGEIPSEAPLHQLGLKTLETLQVVMDVEDAWEGRVFISDEEAEAIHTVGDIERIVAKQLGVPA